jgi:hypothetical protein
MALRKVSLSFYYCLSASIVGGCGGGGNSEAPSTLVPNLSYPTTVVSPWEKTIIQANLTGLSGQQPVCTSAFTSLPVGFVLDQNTCNLTIDGASPGRHSFGVSLAVKGYSGSSEKYHEVNIDGPTLSYKALNNGSPLDAIAWLKPLTLEGGTPVLKGYTPLVGDTLSYGVEGKLPVGISLDPTTGQLSGTAQDTVRNTSYLFAKLTRAGKSIFLRTPELLTPSTPFVIYSNIVATVAQASLQAMPRINPKEPGDTYTFGHATTGGGFQNCGLTSNVKTLTSSQVQFDPSSGAVRPIANTPGVYCIRIATTLTRQGQSVQLSNNSFQFEIR